MIPGPVHVHQQMKFASFNYFASVLINEGKKLRYVQAFGTDGGTNLSEALGHNFPFASLLKIGCSGNTFRGVPPHVPATCPMGC